MAYQATPIRLDPETRATLEGWVRGAKSEQRMVRRARIVLLAADGMPSRAIAREVDAMTRASWLNQVECWFSILQGQSLTGASFTSIEQLKAHIDAYVVQHNASAEPFEWTKSEVHQRRVKGRRLSDL